MLVSTFTLATLACALALVSQQRAAELLTQIALAAHEQFLRRVSAVLDFFAPLPAPNLAASQLKQDVLLQRGLRTQPEFLAEARAGL
ncbi:hypothetical protein [Pseudomonas sp. 5P_3.1_Bac2]|uniref:hypothetical protein n=1 Tax=Pseudomonas sp. 5P_3.1_Bac2 TaxID=2971617 RepID=UPI0021C5FA51|nr:hypothetical protein [Pseudomonas sp. 5P_3.1_Bac2]MCU1717255.1 hypothetical protein [Pseudomonas sp. 5P_3.1_Bac2]